MDELFSDQPEVTTPENPLETLVGEGKKFKTVEDLAKAKWESDRYIEQIQKENAEMRGELKTRVSLQEVMDKLNEKGIQTDTVVEPPTKRSDGHVTEFTPNIEELVERKLTALEQKRKQEDNLRLVEETLKKSFGPSYKEDLRRKAEELGLGKDFLGQLARTQPKAFLHLVGADEQKTQEKFTQPSSTVNTGALKSPSGQKMNFAYFEQIRKTDPVKYFSTTVQNQMFKLAQEMGDSFYT